MNDMDYGLITGRLEDIYSRSIPWNNGFERDDRIYQEYRKALGHLNFQRMDIAIDSMLVDIDIKYFPSIAQIIYHYNQVTPANQAVWQNEQHCYICDNKGFVMYCVKVEDYPGTIPYSAHCVCNIGNKYVYGRAKDSKCVEQYIVKSVMDVFTPQEINDMQTHNRLRSREIVKSPHELRVMLMRVGLNIGGG